MRRSRHVESETDNEDDIPLHHKRAFGAGLKRKKVEFVPAQDPDASSTINGAGTNSTSTLIGDLYASVVLKQDAPPPALKDKEPETCSVCGLPITTTKEKHEASLAHQASITHSHPPSALDRSRMGLRTLASRGWDPDARVGLGREGEGLRYPIKVLAKEDKMGIGAAEEAKRLEEERKKKKVVVEEPVKVLSAKELKVQEAKQRKKGEVLQREIFGRGDLDPYLQKRDEWE